MSKIFYFLFLILLAINSHAAFDMGVGYSVNTRNNLDDSSAVNSLYGLQGSYDWGDINFGLELNYFQDNEVQAGLARIDRKYFDMISWVRYNFVRLSYMDLFFGIGSGAYLERVEVSVFDDSVKEDSRPHWLVAGGLGAKFRFFDRVRPSVEYRVYRRVSAEDQSHGLRLALTYQYD